MNQKEMANNSPKKNTARRLQPGTPHSNNTSSLNNKSGEALVKPRKIDWRCGGYYGEPRRGISRPADKLISLLERELPRIGELDEDQIRHLADTLADGLRHVQLERDERSCTIQHGHPCNINGKQHFADHGQTWIHKGDGRTVVVSHPYNLWTSDMRQLLRLSEAGYDITIDGASHHFPGQTIRVEISSPEGSVE